MAIFAALGVKECDVEMFQYIAPSAVGVWQYPSRLRVFNESACIAVTICCILLESRRIAVRMQKFLPAPPFDSCSTCRRLFTVLHLEYTRVVPKVMSNNFL